MEVQKSIRMAVSTGEVLLGKNETLRSLNTGKCKLVVAANNVPRDLMITLKKRAEMNGVPVYEFEGTSVELGSVCGKPYPVMMMAVIREGDSDILSLVKR